MNLLVVCGLVSKYSFNFLSGKSYIPVEALTTILERLKSYLEKIMNLEMVENLGNML